MCTYHKIVPGRLMNSNYGTSTVIYSINTKIYTLTFRMRVTLHKEHVALVSPDLSCIAHLSVTGQARWGNMETAEERTHGRLRRRRHYISLGQTQGMHTVAFPIKNTVFG